MTTITTMALALLFVPVSLGWAGDRSTGQSFATRSEVLARHAMVATSQPLATQAALEILRAGGSAVDAAIAANAMLCVTEPTGSGLGGDLFAQVWEGPAKRLHGLNGSGRSPATLSLEEFAKRGLTHVPPYGPLPLTVPGCVDAWFELHARFGRLPLKAVLAPAIAAAREGFPVTEVIASAWKLAVARFADEPGFRAEFTIGGRAPQKGEVFRRPALARTLELLASEGRDVFYKGSIAAAVEAYVQQQGGYLSAADFAAHTSTWVEPVSTSYRGYDVWELPPNGQGIAVLQLLNLLETRDLSKLGWGSADHLHFFLECKKLVYEDRARLYADPDFAEVPVASLISKAYAAERLALLSMDKAATSYPVGNPALDQGDTVYLCTADAQGNMVSLIQSNYRGMGSGMTPPGLGFMLQDRGELFDLTPGRPNSYAPGKRPFHTIIPGFVTKDGEAFLAFGVMGGAVQPQGQAWVLSNLLDFGMNLQEAGDAPRPVHEGSSEPTGERMQDGGLVGLETGFTTQVRAELERRGHRFSDQSGNFGGYQAIRWDPVQGVYCGASESRKDGQAAGY